MDSVNQLQSLFEKYGVSAYGEHVTQLQHAVQCAKLAETAHASDSMIAAALLHDVGHLLYNEEMAEMQLNDRHEFLGAQLLERLFGEAVAQPVKLHVMAKRYLCGVNDGYYEGLSEASKESLLLQGGPLEDPRQITVFKRNPFFEQALDLRHWDDEGKDEHDSDDDFTRFVPLLNDLLLPS